jgi:hypothetical protein
MVQLIGLDAIAMHSLAPSSYAIATSYSSLVY